MGEFDQRSRLVRAINQNVFDKDGRVKLSASFWGKRFRPSWSCWHSLCQQWFVLVAMEIKSSHFPGPVAEREGLESATANNNMDDCHLGRVLPAWKSPLFMQMFSALRLPLCDCFTAPNISLLVSILLEAHWRPGCADRAEGWGAINWQRQMWNNVIIHRVSENVLFYACVDIMEWYSWGWHNVMMGSCASYKFRVRHITLACWAIARTINSEFILCCWIFEWL